MDSNHHEAMPARVATVPTKAPSMDTDGSGILRQGRLVHELGDQRRAIAGRSWRAERL